MVSVDIYLSQREPNLSLAVKARRDMIKYIWHVTSA
jgi:hypothetical protein